MMGRYMLIELAWLAGGLALTLAIAGVAAWSYPLGADVIWTIGGIALLVVVAINIAPLRQAQARDRAADRAGGRDG